MSKYMKFFDRFKKKPAVLPAKKEELNRKQYTVSEMEKIIDEIHNDIIQKIGNGEFEIGFNLLKDKTEIYAVLYLDKNNPTYNSLFRDTFWRHKSYEWIFFNIRYEGLIGICKEIAKEMKIEVELTEWSVENIIIDFEKDDYYITKKKTLADCAREKCFAW